MRSSDAVPSLTAEQEQDRRAIEASAASHAYAISQERQNRAAAALMQTLAERGLFVDAPVALRPLDERARKLLTGVRVDAVADGHGGVNRSRVHSDRSEQLAALLREAHALAGMTGAAADTSRGRLVAALRDSALWSAARVSDDTRLPRVAAFHLALNEAANVTPMGVLMAATRGTRQRQVLLLYEWHETQHTQLGNTNSWALGLCCVATGAHDASDTQSATVTCYGAGASAVSMDALPLRYATFVLLPQASAALALDAQRRVTVAGDIRTYDDVEEDIADLEHEYSSYNDRFAGR